VSINESTSVIWKITREYLNCDERYCELSVLERWEWKAWRDGTITYCDVGDMAMEYVAYRYLATTGGA
jgi:hypothetical protein